MYNDFTDTVSAGPKGGRLKETKCQESSKPLGQVEDEIMKTGAQFFGEELLKWLGVKEPVKGIAPTELVHLETRKMYQDFNYVMRNGWWYHIEFESDPLTKADLRRFREYEAATSRTYGVEVLTCVICTANRKHILTEITEGINTYRVKLIQMKKKDGDKILKKIQKKKKLKRKDLIPVLLSPLMGGKSEIKTRILEGIKAVNREDKLINIEEAKKMEAMLYALANKLLSRADLEKIKEEVKMTILGQMLRDDFIEEGRIEGRQEGRQETQERYNRLILCLDKDGKTSLIVKAASDPQLLEKLFQEYGI